RDFESFAHPQDVVGLSQRPLRWRFRWHGSLGRIPFAAALGQPLFDHAFFLIREGIITQKFAKTSLWLPRRHYSAIKNARNSARISQVMVYRRGSLVIDIGIKVINPSTVKPLRFGI